MKEITKALKTKMTVREVIDVLIIVVIIFLLGYLMVYLYISSLNKKMITDKVNNIISVLEFQYEKKDKEVLDYTFPLKKNEEKLLDNLKGRAIVNNPGEVTLKIYLDGYCVTKSYFDAQPSLKKMSSKKCLT